MKKFINVDGNTACSNIAYYLSEVAEIYPITPSSPMAENCDELTCKNAKNIFGNSVLVKEMQSEAGVSGALHGTLCSGVLATTFTSSQGLLLMLPNMFKIAGELLPTVFHISARALATHALSIFGDHSDVMAVRASGFNMICSSSVQEAQDLAIVSHIASLNSSLPFIHFFDGFRTSHEVQKIEEVDYEKIKSIFPFDAVDKFRARKLDPNSPMQKGTAQNPDIFFQNREACNAYYAKVFDCVVDAMKKVESITGRKYSPFEYYGSKNATRLLVIMGSGAETAEETIKQLNALGENVGLIKVRLFRPFNTKSFCDAIPKSVTKIAVLDRCKEVNAICEPLCQDVLSALAKHNKNIICVGGRYGLGGKEFTPCQVKTVFDNLKKSKPLLNFTVGINDDVTNLSLPLDDNFYIDNKTYSMKFFGLGSDGTVGANKNSIKIIGEKTNKFTQGYFEYDSKKSGSITISHLRISDKPIKSAYTIQRANFIAVHNYSFVARYDLLDSLSDNGLVLLNTTLNEEELSRNLPQKFVQDLKSKNAKLFIIDANSIAQSEELGNKINIIMQGAFFKLTKFLQSNEIFETLKTAIIKTYGKKGDAVVQKNLNALNKSLTQLQEINVNKLLGRNYSKSKETKDKYFREYIEPINKLKGNTLPVSKFSVDGSVPTGTTKFEKRGIGEQCPNWNSEECLQCGLCAMACPHSAIRAVLVKDENLKNKPKSFITKNAFGQNNLQYRLQVSPLDCTGCGVCAKVCPAKNKALNMCLTTKILDNERKNLEYIKSLQLEKSPYPENTPKSMQFNKPYFEFPYACAGCGETPYLKLATMLFGDSMIIANATGCSSIYGGSAPACPYTKDESGNGPAWANSLFEDNAEFGLGIKLGVETQKQKLIDLVKEIKKEIPDKLFNEFILNKYLSIENTEKIIKKLENKLKINKNNKKINNLIKNIIKLKNYFNKKSIWIVGGDGWAYDIGFGGLDHILASGENVNILVLDTEVYSNTGGQSSKSTPTGATAKFASNGKITAKKDLGAIALTYPNVYVASISLGANPMQAINAFREAENYDGPSLILAYAPCINHGLNMSNSNAEMKKAVDTGYWNLYRRRPATQNVDEEFILDSNPTRKYQEFLDGETRFTALNKVNAKEAKKFFENSEKDAIKRLENLRKKVKKDV